jgi:hypothetical protein
MLGSAIRSYECPSSGNLFDKGAGISIVVQRQTNGEHWMSRTSAGRGYGLMNHLIQSLAAHRAAFLKFVSGALVAFVLNVVLTWVLVERVGLNYLLSYTFVQLLMVVLALAFYVFVVFQGSRVTAALVIKYLSVLGAVTILNIYTVRNLTEVVGFHYLVSIVLSTGFFVVVKYVLYHRFVFVGDEA